MKSSFKPSINWLLVFIPVSVGVERAHVPAPVLFFSAAALVGGAAESGSAIAMAPRNKLDLTIAPQPGTRLQPR